jgi:hypothetical protein
MKLKPRLAVITYAALCSIAVAQTPAPPAASVALSPAIIMVRCKPGQSTTQTLTIVNHTASEVRFNLATEDVVVRDGKRSYSPAGRIANGIAATSVISPATVVVKAGEEASAQVTFTIPSETGQRAVVTFFQVSSYLPVTARSDWALLWARSLPLTCRTITRWKPDRCEPHSRHPRRTRSFRNSCATAAPNR